mmetsp:Transcript_11477/g.43081  ORF Transcript_11477/g.43081 Transcript_11477/m.43081 type:complete len:84 (-) Transcript_11477:54-305(-)
METSNIEIVDDMQDLEHMGFEEGWLNVYGFAVPEHAHFAYDIRETIQYLQYLVLKHLFMSCDNCRGETNDVSGADEKHVNRTL